MYKHKLSKKRLKHKRKTKKEEKRKRRVRLNTLNSSFPSLILTIPISQIYSQTNKRLISNFKLKGFGPKKVPDDVGFVPNCSHYCRKHAFLILLKLQLHSKSRNVPSYACFSLCTQAASHVHTPRATLVILFLKMDFWSIKRLYSPF